MRMKKPTSNKPSKKAYSKRKLAFESLETRRVMATLPYGAEPDDLGEYMLGRVAVTPVFLESNGQIDPSTEDWTPGQITTVMNNIQSGLNWWTQMLAKKSSVHTLEWVVDRTYVDSLPKTAYEPISRRSNDYDLWVSEFLVNTGFAQTGDLDANIRLFNQSQRQKLNTDWSFTIFVVNSRNDSDGSFAPGGSFTRAFAFAGGRFEVVPSTRPASTFAHETGHIFWARDEYIGGGNYYQTRGYYNSQNSNAIDLNPVPNFQQRTSIMSAGGVMQTAFDTINTDSAALEQIGWKDSDNDGIFDVLDVPLKLEGTGRVSLDGNSYQFVGRASAQALPNRNSSGLQNDITLNRIGKVEYRINGGTWTSASTPNTYTADLNLQIPLLTNTGIIEIRAVDPRTGIESNVFTGTIGDTPDVTSQKGIQGFAWLDPNRNGVWSRNETGLAGATITLVDQNNVPLNTQRQVEPDNYPSGTLTGNLNGTTLTAVGMNTNGTIGVFEDSAATTGTKVFRPFAFSVGSFVDTFSGDDQQLRVRFDNPTSFVSIDAVAVGDGAIARMDAYAADGTLLKRFERKGLLHGQRVTMELGTDTAAIAWVIAYGHNSTHVKLDNVVYGPKNSTKTASDGSYFLPNLEPGNYRVRITPPGPGYTLIAPATDTQSVFLSPSGTVTHIDFGIARDASPWRNATLPEDVDNSRGVDPIDALIVINEINRSSSIALEGSNISFPPYIDVDGDRFLSPLDALMVINYINRQSSGGEGESTPLVSSNDVTASSSSLRLVSFVHDIDDDSPTTWISGISSRNNSRLPSGPEKCGCPGCASFTSASGESSPALIDIARQSSKGTSESSDAISTADELNALQQTNDINTLDSLLSDWNG